MYILFLPIFWRWLHTGPPPRPMGGRFLFLFPLSGLLQAQATHRVRRVGGLYLLREGAKPPSSACSAEAVLRADREQHQSTICHHYVLCCVLAVRSS